MNDGFLTTGSVRVRVVLTAGVAKDIKSYAKERQIHILALIRKQAEQDPRVRPEGTGVPLRGDLSGLCKIKSKADNLRIVYRPVVKESEIVMEIVAIGPRDHDAVYRLALRRTK